MLFAGFNVYQGHLTLLGIIVAGVIGDMLGASIAYAIGYFGRTRAARAPGQQAPREPRDGSTSPTAGSSATGSPVDLRLAVDPGRAGGVPVRRRRRREMPFWRFFVLATLGSIVWIGGLAVRRPRGRAATGRAGATTSSTSTTSAPRSSSRVIVYLIVRRTPSEERGGPATDVVPLTGRRDVAPADLGQALAARRAARPGRAAADLVLGPRRRWSRGCCDWDYVELDDELRKSFEVALHAGTAAALLITLRDEVSSAVRGSEPTAAGADRVVVRAAGDRRLRARATDRAPPRHAGDDRRRACSPARW